MAKKPKVEIISPEMLERELNSPKFTLGLEKAIEITLDTNRESSFNVQKGLFQDQIVYPDLIYIGNGVECGEVQALKYALARYKKSLEAVGKPWSSPRDIGFDRGDFSMFCTANRLLSEQYPKVPEDYSREKENRNAFDFYNLLTFHTHPSSCLTPSLDDLDALNSFRSHVKYLGITTKPIMIIAGVDKEDESHRLLFLQEKDKIPIKKNKLSELRKEINDFLDPRMRLAMDLFGIKQKQYYNKGLGYFNRQNREISLDFDLNEFGYESKAREYSGSGK